LLESSDLDAKTRRQIALGLLEFIERIDDAVPTLSPSQRDWLATEKAVENLSDGRLDNLIESKEFAIEKVKFRTSQIVICLKAIIDGKAKDLKREVLYWTCVSLHWTNEEFWTYTEQLKELNVLDKQRYSQLWLLAACRTFAVSPLFSTTALFGSKT